MFEYRVTRVTIGILYDLSRMEDICHIKIIHIKYSKHQMFQETIVEFSCMKFMRYCSFWLRKSARQYFSSRPDILADNFVFFQDGLQLPNTADFVSSLL